ncbi:MAG: class I SAM-dependent methyltransferase [Gammaproteobacteria bacterium]|uniref:Methyltransferase-related protein n=1 Tax=endosymbiont of Bathymodiolus septemdierum str. Myojin knoll TaxID=1303921 RepID=A0A0P0US07_9GAMM|nr:class I SAM-dependent methyltransferase [Bathymodiolus septemdierum thioautotrophic gill symbiont]RUA07097.1 MAG: class I SAM-dependent methyltransferase [Gammaproteobacteria bacterium]BAS67835.1 methyltransferase-related protein [endosymbiont of Bathymodiolus septemdierum str. Myojin knoll]
MCTVGLAHISTCPLCYSQDLSSYYEDKDAKYLQCFECELVFVPAQYHLHEVDEKLRYDAHQNNPDDEHYRVFLSQVFDPVITHIKQGAKGLDFGCGPGPTLSVMFEEQGYQVDLVDKFYAINTKVFEKKYDFITATEVVEHLKAPRFELDRLFTMLKKGGVLALMTQQVTKKVVFSDWYYKNDLTHICFFTEKSMRYLAQQWGSKIEFYRDNVVLFIKD